MFYVAKTFVFHIAKKKLIFPTSLPRRSVNLFRRKVLQDTVAPCF